MRVTEWRLAPGSATGHHIHEMDYVIVAGDSGRTIHRGAEWGTGRSRQSCFRKAGGCSTSAQREPGRNRVPGSRIETINDFIFLRLPNCHRSVAVDPSMRLKVPASKSRAGVAGMLKYLSKITMDILPSVAATIIGAYIVNHYIATKPGTDAPAAAAVSQAAPKKVDAAARRRRQHACGGRAGKRVSPRRPFSRNRAEKPAEKPAEKSRKNPPKNRIEKTSSRRKTSRPRRRAFRPTPGRHPTAREDGSQVFR